MRLQIRDFLAAVVLFGALAPAASATEVLVVDGDRLVPTTEPYALPPSPPPPAGAAIQERSPLAGIASRAAVGRALAKARSQGRISAAQDRTYRQIYRRALSTRGRLRGARRRELSSVIATVNSIARRGRLTSSRLRPVFVQLKRNAEFWRSKPFPRATAKVRFKGTELLYSTTRAGACGSSRCRTSSSPPPGRRSATSRVCPAPARACGVSSTR